MAAPISPFTDVLPETVVRTVLEDSPDCLVILSREGRLLAMNSAGLRALELDDLRPWQETLWVDRWPPPHHATAHARFRTAAAGATSRFQGVHPTAQGTPKWWDVTLTPVPDEHGTIARLLAVMRDITAERERRADADRAALLHDVKTMLTVVKGEAQLLARRLERADVPTAAAWHSGIVRLVAAVDRLLSRLSQ